MMIYEQDTEARLLAGLLERLTNKTVIDVGAEKGGFVQIFLEAGGEIFAFEPYPPNVQALHERFQDKPSVHIYEFALGEQDETATLHIAEDKVGGNNDSYHSLLMSTDTPTIHWAGELQVKCRTLGGLVDDGTLPTEAGILKIDTEGNDFAVIQGMGKLSSAVVMIEYWDELPDTVGFCPYKLGDVAEVMRQRGYSNFAFVKRWDEFESIQVNDTHSHSGEWGNVLFIHDYVTSQLLPVIFAAMATVHRRLLDKALMFKTECQNRLEVINLLDAKVKLPDVIPLDQRLASLSETVSRIEDRMAKLGEIVERTDQRTIRLEQTMQSHPPKNWRGLVRKMRVSIVTRVLPMPRLGILEQYPPIAVKLPPYYAATICRVSPAPGISIVTPSFNQGEFVERTIKSVLDQNYPNLEYIIQDGGSKDQTVQILDRYRARLASVESVKDNGQADAINRGFARTTGEIMAYLNSDDLLVPGSLHYVGEFFARHPEIDAVYGHRILIDKLDREVGRWVLPHHNNTVLSWADYVPQETLFWRRRLWDKIGGAVDESFRFALDWDLLLRFRDAGAKFARLPRFLGAFRVHSAQKTSAQFEIGQQEMYRLRERCAGRSVTPTEVARSIIPYMRWHRVYDRLYRLHILRY